MLNEDFLKQVQEKLEAEKKRLEERISRITAPESHIDNPQWDETANDAIEDIEQEAYLRIYKELLDKVDVALEKIKNGKYGQCSVCNNEISEDVLLKEPWVEYCGRECAGS